MKSNSIVLLLLDDNFHTKIGSLLVYQQKKNAICFEVINPNALHSHIVGALEAGKMLQVQHLHFLYFAFFSMGVGDGGGVEGEYSWIVHLNLYQSLTHN